MVDRSFVFSIAFMHFHAPKKVWVVTSDKKLFTQGTTKQHWKEIGERMVWSYMSESYKQRCGNTISKMRIVCQLQ
jgi:ribosome biogenesis protein Nip4